MKKILAVLFIFALVGAGKVYAQQDPIITQYMFNGLYFNPALAGMEGQAKVSFLARAQWLGGSTDNGTPNTQLLTFNTALPKNYGGAGINLIRDYAGLMTNTDVQLSYAYHMNLGKGKLSIAPRLGIVTRSYEGSKYRPNDENDPLVNKSNVSATTYDVTGGIYYKADKYFAGVSVAHLVPTKYNVGASKTSTVTGVDGLRDPYVPCVYVTGGYIFDINPEWTLTPSFLYRTTDLTDMKQSSYDVNVMAAYRNRFWLGGTYRDSWGPAALVAFSMLKDNALKISYSCDFTLPADEVRQLTSHEIGVTYNLNIGNRPAKPVIRTPRYRK
ncbi:MAG: type IX secretion system membrane protein PorP/SprF [Bacteroidota bacterium]